MLHVLSRDAIHPGSKAKFKADVHACAAALFKAMEREGIKVFEYHSEYKQTRDPFFVQTAFIEAMQAKTFDPFFIHTIAIRVMGWPDSATSERKIEKAVPVNAANLTARPDGALSFSLVLLKKDEPPMEKGLFSIEKGQPVVRFTISQKLTRSGHYRVTVEHPGRPLLGRADYPGIRFKRLGRDMLKLLRSQGKTHSRFNISANDLDGTASAAVMKMMRQRVISANRNYMKRVI
jgi:hypothetical protein